MAKKKKRKASKFNKKKTLAIIFIVLIAGLGVYLLGASRAATPAASLEAENGSLAGGATTINDSIASGGKAVKFNKPSSNPSWGCATYNGSNASLSNYGPDSTKMELNTDVFAPASPFSETICGNNTAFHADVNAGACGGCVQSYPSIKYRYDQSSWVGCCSEPGGSVPISTIKSWTSSWSVNFPASTNAQAAYDLWFANNCGALGGHDIMVWVSTTASRGTGGGPVINANLIIDGRSTTQITYGTPGVKTTETIFKFNTNEPSGSIDLMKVVAAGQATGDLKACDSRGLMILNADFGYEVAQTSGVQTFNVLDFHNTITTNDGKVHI